MKERTNQTITYEKWFSSMSAVTLMHSCYRCPSQEVRNVNAYLRISSREPEKAGQVEKWKKRDNSEVLYEEHNSNIQWNANKGT